MASAKQYAKRWRACIHADISARHIDERACSVTRDTPMRACIEHGDACASIIVVRVQAMLMQVMHGDHRVHSIESIVRS
jgi:hypothetical protein